MTADAAFASIGELAPLIERKHLSPVELTETMLARIEALNPELNAYLTVAADEARAAARQAEQEIMRGNYKGPLHGIPVAHKDVFYTKGLRTTAHSKVLEHFVPDEDATAVARLRAAGTVLLGKLNTHEFACGGMDFWGFGRNPWNPACVPGGSSSGSAIALGAHLTYGSLGTDTGGSIRIPASFCGVVGLKGTYGRVSRHGVTPLSFTMDHPGPLAKTVADAALLMNAISGPDPKDSHTLHGRPQGDFGALLGRDLKGVRLGVPRRFFYEGLDPEVEAAVQAALNQLAALGADLVEVDIPHADLSGQAHYTIIFSEAAAIFERELDEQPHNFSKTTYHRISMGRFFTATEYVRAQRMRALLIEETEAAMRDVDALVTPTAPYTAYPIDAFTQSQGDVVRFTRLADLTGQPSLSLPCGFTEQGMPIGLMITGHPWDEANVLRIGHAYEQAAGWHKRRAPIAERV